MSEFRTCKQNNCLESAALRYTWPGQDESYCCIVHGFSLKRVANGIGLRLKFIPLSVDEMLNLTGE